jgi:hypothetical protein
MRALRHTVEAEAVWTAPFLFLSSQLSETCSSGLSVVIEVDVGWVRIGGFERVPDIVRKDVSLARFCQLPLITITLGQFPKVIAKRRQH